MPNLDHTIEQAKIHLLKAHSQLKAEIGCYPTPIAGCDAQFEYLLIKQRQVGQALSILNADLADSTQH